MGPWMTTAEAAQVLGYAPGYVREMAYAGRLRATRAGRCIRVCREDVERMAARGQRAWELAMSAQLVAVERAGR